MIHALVQPKHKKVHDVPVRGETVQRDTFDHIYRKLMDLPSVHAGLGLDRREIRCRLSIAHQEDCDIVYHGPVEPRPGCARQLRGAEARVCSCGGVMVRAGSLGIDEARLHLLPESGGIHPEE